MSAPRLAVLAALVLLAGCATSSPAPETKPMAPVENTTAAQPKAVTPAAPPPAAAPIPLRALKAPAAMEVVSLPVANKPIVTFKLVFRTGSIDDPKGKEGLTSLATHVLSEGGTQKLSSSELLQALFPMAAELSVTTDKEFTSFDGRVHKDNLDRFLEIFTDVLLAPRYDAKEFERLRADAVNGIRNGLRGEDDETLGKVGLDALLYADHPYRHDVGGTVAGLSAITLDDLKAHVKRVFTQDRLVIGLAGAVDAKLQKKLVDRLSALPKTGAPAVMLPPAPGVKQQAMILEKDAISTAVSFGYSWNLRREDPDFFPLALALSYLGDHRQSSGVLFQQLREARGMNYGDYAYVEHFHQDPGTTYARTNIGRSEQDFTIWIRPVEPQNAIFATRGAVHFLRRLIDEGIPQEDFERTRGFLLGYSRLWEQTDARRLGYAIDERFYGGRDFLNRYREALQKMSVADVNAAVKRQLSLDRLNFVFVAKDAAGLAKALAAQTAPTISYPTPKGKAVLSEDAAITATPLPIHPGRIEVVDAQTFMER